MFLDFRMSNNETSVPHRLEIKMRKTMLLKNAFVVIAALVSFGPIEHVHSAEALPESQEIKIDIPVKLKKAQVVFNMDHLAFAGDQPIGLKYMNLMVQRLDEAKVKGRVYAVFHGDAGYMTLNDEAYNAFRGVKTGNPYKDQIVDLLKRGVQIEECAVTMKTRKWENSDLIDGVKVNTGAIARLLELNQQGFYEVHP
jgi:intracellular sulfur oxidation DsrE/DsrF family protein